MHFDLFSCPLDPAKKLQLFQFLLKPRWSCSRWRNDVQPLDLCFIPGIIFLGGETVTVTITFRTDTGIGCFKCWYLGCAVTLLTIYSKQYQQDFLHAPTFLHCTLI